MTEDHSMKNMLTDSFDQPIKNESPESANSTYDGRCRNADNVQNRQKMCSSVRTNFSQYRHFNGAPNYRTSCLNKNQNLKQYVNQVNQYNTSQNRPQESRNLDKAAMRVHSNHSPHSVVGLDCRRSSPLNSKVSYHSHYLEHEESPQSMMLDNIKGTKFSIPHDPKHQAQRNNVYSTNYNIGNSVGDQQPKFTLNNNIQMLNRSKAVASEQQKSKTMLGRFVVDE